MKHPKNFPSVPLEQKRFLPSIPGIYFALLDDVVMYVGMASNINSRWQKHHKYEILSKMNGIRIHYIQSDGRNLLEQESEWIKTFSPPLNIAPARFYVTESVKGKEISTTFIGIFMLLMLVSSVSLFYVFITWSWEYAVIPLGCEIFSLGFYVGGRVMWWLFGNVFNARIETGKE